MLLRPEKDGVHGWLVKQLEVYVVCSFPAFASAVLVWNATTPKQRTKLGGW